MIGDQQGRNIERDQRDFKTNKGPEIRSGKANHKSEQQRENN